MILIPFDIIIGLVLEIFEIMQLESISRGLNYVTQFAFCFVECCREASFLYAKLDCNVSVQCIHCGVGFGGWVWVWRMGQHVQLHQAN